MNNVNLIGNLGQDPEITWKNFTNAEGKEEAFCTVLFSVAVPEWSKKEKKNIPNWIKCKAAGKTAENIGNFFKKGSSIAIEGKIKTDTWKNEADENRSMTYVSVNKFDFLTKKDDANSQQQTQAQQEYGETELTQEELDVIPF